MIKIQIKNGDIDAALDKFKTAKTEQNRAFEQKVANYFAPKDQQQEQQQQPGQRPAPTYQSILSRSKRVG